MSNTNLEQYNSTRLELLNKAKEKYPILHGLAFDISLRPSSTGAAGKMSKVFNTLVRKINIDSAIAKNAVLCFVEGGVIESNLPYIALSIFYTTPIETSELNNRIEDSYIELYNILSDYEDVHVQSYFDSMSTEYLEYLGIPFSTDVHNDVGFKRFKATIKLDRSMKHHCHANIKFGL